MIIDDVIERAGGVSALARDMEVHHAAVIQWRRRERLPVKRAQQIHARYDIPLHLLRPDIWPELAEQAA